jgi:P-type E1-E2 ATPase
MVADDEHHRWSALVERLNASDAERRLAICVDGHLAGAAAVSEEHVARIDSMKSAFQQLGVSTILMTGDERERAEQIGFERTYAECTPTQKQSIVEQLQAEADGVCYIGDGINDAVAMTAADVGIARGDGSTLTIDSADIVWHGSDLRDIPSLFRSAREAVRVIRSNLGYAIAYNLAGMGAAAVGWLHPVLAAVLMVASSLFVTWRTALTLDGSA